MEQPSDIECIRALHLAAFGGHGNTVAGLVDDLRASTRETDRVSVVATDDAGVVGHALFTPSLLDAPSRLVVVQVLSPVAVAPRRQRRGIGSALIRRGLDILARRRVPIVFLEGPPEYYARFGFESGTRIGFRRPSLRIPEHAFQALRLPAYEPWMTGTLVYAEAFWRHDAVGLRDGRE